MSLLHFRFFSRLNRLNTFWGHEKLKKLDLLFRLYNNSSAYFILLEYPPFFPKMAGYRTIVSIICLFAFWQVFCEPHNEAPQCNRTKILDLLENFVNDRVSQVRIFLFKKERDIGFIVCDFRLFLKRNCLGF